MVLHCDTNNIKDLPLGITVCNEIFSGGLMIVSDEYLLRLFREIVGSRAKWKCEFPGCNAFGKDLNPHHHFSRDNHSVRYDPENGLWLCTPHHNGNVFSAHRSPTWFLSMILLYEVRTPEWLEELTIKKNQIVKANNSFRCDWKNKLQELAA